MKHHRTNDAVAIKIKGQLEKEQDRLLDKDIHTISEKDRWMLDLDPSDKAVMSIWELQYMVFELKAAKV
jgi:hypothetical protein